MGQNHSANLVRELQAPGAEKRNECRGINNSRIIVSWVGQPDNLNSCGSWEG